VLLILLAGPINIMIPRKGVRPFLRKPLHRSSNNTSYEIVPVSSSGVLGDKSSSASSNSPQEEAAAKQHHQQERSTTRTLERHLTLTDLIAIGIGGTIGSG
jgi:amino acid permease